jgi:hypothetical protein
MSSALELTIRMATTESPGDRSGRDVAGASRMSQDAQGRAKMEGDRGRAAGRPPSRRATRCLPSESLSRTLQGALAHVVESIAQVIERRVFGVEAAAGERVVATVREPMVEVRRELRHSSGRVLRGSALGHRGPTSPGGEKDGGALNARADAAVMVSRRGWVYR